MNLKNNSHTSDTGIMPPSELGREERVLTRVTLRWEMNCSGSRLAWAAAPTPACKSDRDWLAFLLAEVKVMQSGGVKDWNLKGCRVAREIMNLFRCWCHGSQRHRCKKSPSVTPQFMRSYAKRGCGLELSERVLTKQRNPEETENVMASGSSKEVSKSDLTR